MTVDKCHENLKWILKNHHARANGNHGWRHFLNNFLATNTTVKYGYIWIHFK